MKECLECSKDTKNPKFCSRSCAATYNNKLSHFKHGKYISSKIKCKICGNPKAHTSKNCNSCYKNIMKFQFYKKYLKNELKDVLVARLTFRETTAVRENARRLWKHLNYSTSCEICCYSKHVQICHIYPIARFKSENRLAIINSPSNMIALCPNCHWEFDNNSMELDIVNKIHKISQRRAKPYLQNKERVES